MIAPASLADWALLGGSLAFLGGCAAIGYRWILRDSEDARAAADKERSSRGRRPRFRVPARRKIRLARLPRVSAAARRRIRPRTRTRS